MNLPSKNDVAAITAAIERLDLRVAHQQRSLAAIEQRLDQMKAALEAVSRTPRADQD